MSILRADSIRDRAGTGAPNFPNGATVTGVVTATSFSGDGSALTGIDASTLRHNNNTKAQATATGVDVTGNLGVSGNLTVNGTTTTIDTAVTSVDSLAVDGSVGIGTTNPAVKLHVAANEPQVYIQDSNSNGNYVNATIQFRDNNNSQLSYFGYASTSDRHLSLFNTMINGALRFGTGGTERLRITSGGMALFTGGLAEKVNVKAQLTGANDCAITDGNVILTTTNEPGNTYPNITGVHSVLTSGQGLSFTVALKVNGSGTINSIWIDGWTQTIKWSGGSAPSAGSSGHDVFTFTVVKTGNGVTDYTVFGAATNYA